MSIRRKLTATGATAALVLGGVFAATPAYAAAHSWGPLFGNKSTCQIQTAKKAASIARQKPISVKVRYKCKEQDGYYHTYIEWRTR
ncbi:hypothetical protein JD276_15205 [Leucobacter sp. CSA1]|uniref:Secreted protein n=1 Tax=Leucobacter chromiisoli TaxID=2796471 RepID=A0A934QAW4_9MICO|nr:hypothetical protein [Leucobacter chromiisoli]MBK0420376.1 hypothetical protein [Leucobacter chromiisoli]